MAQETASLIIACACGQKLKVPAKAVGKSVACTKCGEKIKISAEAVQSSGGTSAKEVSDKRRSVPVVRTDVPVMDALLDIGIIEQADVDYARKVQQDLPLSDWETLINIGCVPSEDFHNLMAQQKGMTVIDLKNYSIPGDVLDFVSGELVQRGRLFPVDKLGKLLTIAMACPIDSATIKEVESETGLQVKIMLCKLEDVRELTRLYFPEKREQVAHDDTFSKDLAKEFNELLDANAVARKIFDMDPLAPLTAAMDQVKQVAASGDGALQKMIEVLKQDPTCTALVLSPANSAAYGFAKRVDNVDLAVSLLGADGAAEVLGGYPARDYFSENGGFDAKIFWARAKFCAQAAYAIATNLDSQRTQAACTAALLHSIGRLGLATAMPNSYGAVTQGKSGEDVLKAEECVYHISHTEVGYMLARKWNLPPGLTEPIRYHRNPNEASKSKEVVNIVALAALMADAREKGKKFTINEETYAELLDSLILTKAKAEVIYRQITEGGS